MQNTEYNCLIKLKISLPIKKFLFKVSLTNWSAVLEIHVKQTEKKEKRKKQNTVFDTINVDLVDIKKKYEINNKMKR